MASNSNISVDMPKLQQAPGYMSDALDFINNAKVFLDEFYIKLQQTGYTGRTSYYIADFNEIKVDVSHIYDRTSEIQTDCISVISTIKNFDSGMSDAAADLQGAADKLTDSDVADLTGAEAGATEENNSVWANICGWFVELGSEICNFIQGVVATFVDAVISLFQGLVKLVEGIVDAAVLLVGTVVAVGASVINWMFGTEIDVQSIKDWVQGFVATDWTGSVFNAFYEKTGFGNWLKDNSIIYGTAFRDVLVGTATWVGIIVVGAVVTFFTGGTALAPYCALVGGLYGLGSGTETAWANGASYYGGAGIGLLKGGIYAISAYSMGKSCQGLYDSVVANLGGSSSTAIATTGATVAGGSPTAVGQMDVNTAISNATASGNSKLAGVSQWFADHGATSVVGYSDGTVSFLTADGSILGTISSSGFEYISPAMQALTTGLATAGGPGVAGLLPGAVIETVGGAAAAEIGLGSIAAGLIGRGIVEAALSTSTTTGVPGFTPVNEEETPELTIPEETPEETSEEPSEETTDENTEEPTTEETTEEYTEPEPTYEPSDEPHPEPTEEYKPSPTPDPVPDPDPTTEDTTPEETTPEETSEDESSEEETSEEETSEEETSEESSEESSEEETSEEEAMTGPDVILKRVGPEVITIPDEPVNEYQGGYSGGSVVQPAQPASGVTEPSYEPDPNTITPDVPNETPEPTYNWESATPTVENPDADLVTDVTGGEDVVREVAANEIEFQATQTSGNTSTSSTSDVGTMSVKAQSGVNTSNSNTYTDPGFDTSILGMGGVAVAAGGLTTYGAARKNREDEENKKNAEELEKKNEEYKNKFGEF